MSAAHLSITADVFGFPRGDQNRQILHTDLSGIRSLSAADNDLEVCGVSALISALPGGLIRLNLSGTCRHTSIVQALQQSIREFSEVSL